MPNAPAKTEPQVIPDPFLSDDGFGGVDFRGDNGGSIADEIERLAREGPGEDPANKPQTDGDPEPEPTVAVAPAPEPDQPKVIEYEDGSSVTIEHGSKGWKATLDANTGGNPEIFYGGTKDELMINMAVGKISGTQEVRKMKSKMKLESAATIVNTPAPAAVPEAYTPRSLTADEVFEIKTKLGDNPDLALETWFQKKTGMGVAQLVKFAEQGKTAADLLDAESIGRDFVAQHQEYIPYEKNYTQIIKWLSAHKLGVILEEGEDPSAMIEKLYKTGNWTLKNLNTAYNDLVSDGLLDLRVEEQPPTEEAPVVTAPPAAKAPAAAPTPTDERIASQVRRPRAGNANYGIRQRETVAARTEAAPPPSVEELDNLSDDEITKLLAGVRQQNRLSHTRR